MDTESQRLEREILHTREQLGENVDALVDRIDPRRVAAREVAKARSSAERNPGKAAMVGAGAVAVLAGLIAWRAKHR